MQRPKSSIVDLSVGFQVGSILLPGRWRVIYRSSKNASISDCDNVVMAEITDTSLLSELVWIGPGLPDDDHPSKERHVIFCQQKGDPRIRYITLDVQGWRDFWTNIDSENHQWMCDRVKKAINAKNRMPCGRLFFDPRLYDEIISVRIADLHAWEKTRVPNIFQIAADARPPAYVE